MAASVGEGAGPRLDEVVLAASELAAHALRYGRGGYEVQVAIGVGYAWVGVVDEDPTPPAPFAVRRDDGGLGLQVVEAVSDRWGVSPSGGGKVVWCEFTWVPADRGPTAQAPRRRRGTRR